MIISSQNLRAIFIGFNTTLNKALEEQKPLYDRVATVVPSTTDAETYAWLGDMPGMREWLGEREIKNLSGSDYTIKNKDFELTVGVPRNAIEDDKIGLYTPSVQMLGQSAAMHPDELIFGLLKKGFTEKCFDGKPFFSADHEIKEGEKVSNKGTAKLTLDSYIAARAAMMALTNAAGNGFDVPPHRRRSCAGYRAELARCASRTGRRGSQYHYGGLHQRQHQHHEGHSGGAGRAAACGQRCGVVSALYYSPDPPADLPAAPQGEVCRQDRRKRRQCLL